MSTPADHPSAMPWGRTDDPPAAPPIQTEEEQLDQLRRDLASAHERLRAAHDEIQGRKDDEATLVASLEALRRNLDAAERTASRLLSANMALQRKLVRESARLRTARAAIHHLADLVAD